MKYYRLVFAILFLLTSLSLAQETIVKLPTTDNTSGFVVKGSDNENLLKVMGDGGFYLKGNYGTGTIPIVNTGTRLMWYPGKAAFRVGYVDGTQWDDTNIGGYSVAMGYGTTASGGVSTAMGYFTTASEIFSTAMGYFTTASGYYSTAMGYETTASGELSTVMGNRTTAQAYTSLVIGKFNQISGTTDSWVATDPLFVVGNGSAEDNRSNALTLLKNGKLGIINSSPSAQLHIGGTEGLLAEGTISSGTQLSLGAGTRMHWYPYKAAFRVGYVSGTQWDNANIGNYSVAMGGETTASGIVSTAMGSETTASGLVSTAMGYSTTASGYYSTVMGNETTAQSFNSLVIGRFNEISGTTNSWEATEPLFVCGNGSAADTPSNALTLLKNGNMTIAGTLTENSDIRLKENINPLNSVLSSLNDIEPIYYEFKDKQTRPAGRHIGLIAQEVEEAFPELVREDSQGYKSVEYTKLTAVLLQAIKEQQKMIDELTAKVNSLSGK